MQIYEAAIKALQELGEPTHVQLLRQYIEEKDYFTFGAQDPGNALGAAMGRHAKGIRVSNSFSPTVFYRDSPATWGLLEWLDQQAIANLTIDDEAQEMAEREDLDSSLFLEKELHEFLFKNLEQNGLSSLGFGPLSLADQEKQKNVMGKYSTGVVGEIDMLLKTLKGDYVLLELKRAGDDKTVGQICRYFGWVQEHLAGPEGREIYGVILAQDINDRLRYAVKATNQKIDFRKIEIAIKFADAGRIDD